MQAFSLSLESMASRSLLHDIGVQRPRVIQFAAWQPTAQESRTAAAGLQRLWQSSDFANPAAEFGLLAMNSNIQSGEEWESVTASLSESRCSSVIRILPRWSLSKRLINYICCHAFPLSGTILKLHRSVIWCKPCVKAPSLLLRSTTFS